MRDADIRQETHSHSQVEVRPVAGIILDILSDSAGGVEFRSLLSLMGARIGAEDKANLGSVSWYATTVKLDMEVKGDIVRVPGAKPQRLRLAE